MLTSNTLGAKLIYAFKRKRRFQKMRRLRERFYYFMQGRYGTDNLYNFLLATYLILLVINLFLGSFLISSLTLALLVYMFFRVFSRNIYKRRKENERYLQLSKKPRDFLILTKNRFRDRNTHVYKTCPACKSTLRLPKQKGKHTAVCPRCSRRFEVKI